MNSKISYPLLVGIAIADLLAAIDNTAVNIAIPKIAQFFQLSPSKVSWFQTVYILSLIIMLIPAGKIGDRIGHKKSFLFGLILFGLSSLTIIFVQQFTLLMALRFLQGVAAAILYTSSSSLIAYQFKNSELAFGVTGAFLSLGLLLGPTIGGLLTDQTFSHMQGWQLIFAINLPLVLLSSWLIYRYSRETTVLTAGKPIDFLGLTLLALFLGSLTFLFVQTGYKLALSLIALGSILTLIGYESGQDDPLLRGEIFRNRTFSAISVFTLVFMLSLLGLSFINTFYLQDVLGHSATTAGLMMTPIFLGMGVFSLIAGAIHAWRPSVIAASLLLLLGLFILSRVNPTIPYFQGLFWGYLLISAGAGFMMTNTFAAALGSVKKELAGLAAGYINTAQQIGGLIGVAFVAGQNVTKDYQQIYYYLLLIAILALVASLFVKNKKGLT